jgi:hypothetical protein
MGYEEKPQPGVLTQMKLPTKMQLLGSYKSNPCTGPCERINMMMNEEDFYDIMMASLSRDSMHTYLYILTVNCMSCGRSGKLEI